jgi:hypothetical protein
LVQRASWRSYPVNSPLFPTVLTHSDIERGNVKDTLKNSAPTSCLGAISWKRNENVSLWIKMAMYMNSSS